MTQFDLLPRKLIHLNSLFPGIITAGDYDMKKKFTEEQIALCPAAGGNGTEAIMFLRGR